MPNTREFIIREHNVFVVQVPVGQDPLEYFTSLSSVERDEAWQDVAREVDESEGVKDW